MKIRFSLALVSNVYQSFVTHVSYKISVSGEAASNGDDLIISIA